MAAPTTRWVCHPAGFMALDPASRLTIRYEPRKGTLVIRGADVDVLSEGGVDRPQFLSVVALRSRAVSWRVHYQWALANFDAQTPEEEIAALSLIQRIADYGPDDAVVIDLGMATEEAYVVRYYDLEAEITISRSSDEVFVTRISRRP